MTRSESGSLGGVVDWIDGIDKVSGNGAQWGAASDDLNATLVHWEKGKGVAPHTNTEVDVVMVTLSGEGEVVVDGSVTMVRQGTVLVIPKGAEREVRATSDLVYVNVHRRRFGLQLSAGRPSAR